MGFVYFVDSQSKISSNFKDIWTGFTHIGG